MKQNKRSQRYRPRYEQRMGDANIKQVRIFYYIGNVLSGNGKYVTPKSEVAVE